MFGSDTISVVLTAVIASFTAYYLLKNYERNKKLPPGPWGLPILGYTPFLTLRPHLKLTELAKTYGNVFSLKLGTRNAVFLNDWPSIKEAFSKDELLGRPEDLLPEVFTKNRYNIGNGSGKFWKENRRLVLRVFRDLGFGKQTMENNIKDEITKLSNEIDKKIDEPINIHELLIPSVSNNICYFLFGHCFLNDNPMRKKIDTLLSNAPQLLQVPLGISFLPFMIMICKLPLFKALQFTSAIKAFNEVEQAIDDEIKAHERTLDENDTKDYLNGFLMERKLRENKSDSEFFTNSVLNSNAMTLIGAGSETVRSILDWILKHIAHDTELQKAVQKEVDSVVGKDRLPSWSDHEFMPLTRAVILETHRFASALPLNLPRLTLEDITISGHSIPKNTIVIANFWSVNRDPNLFSNPDEFNPYRFVSKDGKFEKCEALVPFSYGKRSCVGETLAKFELFLYFTMLMQKYEITVPEGVKTSFDMWLGLSLQPTQIPILRFKKR